MYTYTVDSWTNTDLNCRGPLHLGVLSPVNTYYSTTRSAVSWIHTVWPLRYGGLTEVTDFVQGSVPLIHAVRESDVCVYTCVCISLPFFAQMEALTYITEHPVFFKFNNILWDDSVSLENEAMHFGPFVLGTWITLTNIFWGLLWCRLYPQHWRCKDEENMDLVLQGLLAALMWETLHLKYSGWLEAG